MIAFISFVLAVLASPFKSKSRLEAENAVDSRHSGRGPATSGPEEWTLSERPGWSVLCPSGRDEVADYGSTGQKNDFRDAEAIAEAVQRPTDVRRTMLIAY